MSPLSFSFHVHPSTQRTTLPTRPNPLEPDEAERLVARGESARHNDKRVTGSLLFCAIAKVPGRCDGPGLAASDSEVKTPSLHPNRLPVSPRHYWEGYLAKRPKSIVATPAGQYNNFSKNLAENGFWSEEHSVRKTTGIPGGNVAKS